MARFPLVLGVSLAAHVGFAAFAFVATMPRHHADAPADPAPALAGDTFELPAPETLDTPLANASPSPDTESAPAPIDDPDAPARPTPPSRAAHGARPSHQGRPSAGHAPPGPAESGGSTGSAQLYGAVGERTATDLARTFGFAFRQAASAAPEWKSAPIGPAGEATVVLTLDESGHIESSRVEGAPSPALREGIRRTMALIGSRLFVAKAKVTKLHVAARVTTDASRDNVFALGSGENDAFFTVPIDRRVEVSIHAR